MIRITAPGSGCCLCVMHTLAGFPLESKGCFSVSKLLNEFKGERRKHRRYFFLCSLLHVLELQTVVCSFTQMTDCLRVGRKNKKTTLKFLKFRGRLKRPACLDISEIEATVGNTV